MVRHCPPRSGRFHRRSCWLAGEEGAPDPDLATAPGQTRIYETGAGADTAAGGIRSAIYDNDRLEEEGARITTSTGESIEAPCVS